MTLAATVAVATASAAAAGIQAALAEHPTWDLLSKDKLYKRLHAAGVVKTRAVYNAWWQARASKTAAGGPVHELFAKPNKRFAFARIAAPPYLYQIDVVRMDRYKRHNKGVTWRFLLLAYKKFLKEIGVTPFLIQGDDYFAAKEFTAFNESRDIPIFTNVARDEHVTTGDLLGILDRLVQTLRNMIEKRIFARDDLKWTQWLGEVLHDYNTNPHSTLDDDTPDEYNRQASKPVVEHFWLNDYVRVCLAKGTFTKGATQTVSLEVYQVVSVRGTRISLKTYPQGEAVGRAAKSNELVKVDKPAHTAPATAQVPPAVATAQTEARRSQRLAKEGLPDVPLPKEPKAATVAANVAAGQLLVIVDGEGAADNNPNRLTIAQGARTGYVYAGIVTKTASKKLHVKLLHGTGANTALSQKGLKLSPKSQAIDNTYSDAVLYAGDAPRIRSDGTNSLPAKVVAEVKAEYVFT
ncbi:hypothetical protein COO60DRAFT_1675174 [Scenedesmus sp. NREL 46B-D3]|nr:hypothetical protein COO60DRAFT_1675174 [Scenedesmus sp. NREL 46B-D3]